MDRLRCGRKGAAGQRGLARPDEGGLASTGCLARAPRPVVQAHASPAPSVAARVRVSRAQVAFAQGTPFRPFEQLLAVLPAASGKLLPPALRTLMTEPASPIIDFYPATFEVCCAVLCCVIVWFLLCGPCMPERVRMWGGPVGGATAHVLQCVGETCACSAPPDRGLARPSPSSPQVDMEGKRADWEGIVLVPFVDEVSGAMYWGNDFVFTSKVDFLKTRAGLAWQRPEEFVPLVAKERPWGGYLAENGTWRGSVGKGLAEGTCLVLRKGRSSIVQRRRDQ